MENLEEKRLYTWLKNIEIYMKIESDREDLEFEN